ncbi:ABC transporter ATP-binding protein [Puniceibacterium sp. IMCC21224]|uniref:ABC transporter ATP-binding protein n=1 Tax=Puniceibacterium sp. IMCC21224 TaxID=1618204 RepID=UPI00064DCCE1|nr:ABC transporter ATP-binding protein [Puniceibacterium sp. IMCC21224]KMK64976.1 ABC-type nitrate/sulfonate/bicarbonate transport system, ATPase component [Puniceibacterium sp. IMCC21224]
MTNISIDGATKVFNSRDGEKIVALQDVTLAVRPNEFISLVGPSGCGKSTLLRMIGGLLPTTDGAVLIDGNVVDGPQIKCGFVFQKATLLDWKTILENVLFPLNVLKTRTSASVDSARELLAFAGLSDFESKYPSELSGGMQQRAGICRALMHDPDILLMDEPFGALDALTREDMSLELLRIWRERPKTIVFVTHSIAEAVLLSDRVVVMSARPGRVSEIVDIPLPRPRSFEAQKDVLFQEKVEHIRYLITGK